MKTKKPKTWSECMEEIEEESSEEEDFLDELKEGLKK